MDERRPYPTIDEIALGGLLHDVGKLFQRAAGKWPLPEAARKRDFIVLPERQGRYTHWHALWTDAFFDQIEHERLAWPRGVDRRWVRDLAVFHHRPLDGTRELPGLAATWLETVADHVAAGMERKPKDEAADSEPGPASFRRTPLDALMARLDISEGERSFPPAGRAFHRPAPLEADAIMPHSQVDGDEVERGYLGLWDAFLAGWRELAARAAGDVRAFEEGALNLGERLTWAVPSSTVDQPDIPLHDHARVVAAVAACLWAHHAERGETADLAAFRDEARPRLRFLVGDLSGLQPTLFRLASEQVKGLNRILRGRSQRFALIADAAVRRVLAALGLPAACALQTAGGRFLVLVPALGEDGLRARVDELRAEFDDWLASQYYGDLGIGLALSDPFATGDLVRRADEASVDAAETRARKVFDALSVAIETAKLRQLEGPATRAMFDVAYPAGVCSACGVRPARAETEPPRCDACEAEHATGQRLPRARAIVLREVSSPEDAPGWDRLFGLPYAVVRGDGSERHDRGRGWRFDEAAHGPFPVRFGNLHVAQFGDDLSHYRGLEDFDDIEPGDIKTFAALGEDSLDRDESGQPIGGRPMLAAIKADVDRLGLLFAHGLGEDFGLARRAALSRMVDAYFTGRLKALLESRCPNAYTVYAGGDDLFIVAPWRDALAFARLLREDFAAFSNHNPSVTLSAGIALFQPRTPISIAAREAEQRLEAAKAAGRDRVSAIARTPMRWEDYALALDVAERLGGWLRAGTLATGALYRFLWFDEARERVAAGEGTAHDLAWKARLGYHLARMLPKRRHDPLQREIAETLLGLFGLTERLSEHRAVPGARLAISHALYRNR